MTEDLNGAIERIEDVLSAFGAFGPEPGRSRPLLVMQDNRGVHALYQEDIRAVISAAQQYETSPFTEYGKRSER